MRTTMAPTVQAMEWIRANGAPGSGTLYVGKAMVPFVDHYLPSLRTRRALDEHALPLRDTPGFLVAEWCSGEGGEVVFRRERGHLWNVGRRHYFDVSISPLRPPPRFLSGWSTDEQDDRGEFRRMGDRSTMMLPPLPAPAVLSMELEVPAVTHRVEIRLDGALLGSVGPGGSTLEVEYAVDPTAALEHRLEIDARGGLVLRRISWGHRLRKEPR